MAKSAPNHDDILEEAKNVLYGNLKIGYSSWAEENYKYVSPSPSHYPYQWMWDSCFHAITLSHFDVGLAKNEIRNLLKLLNPEKPMDAPIIVAKPQVKEASKSVENVKPAKKKTKAKKPAPTETDIPTKTPKEQ